MVILTAVVAGATSLYAYYPPYEEYQAYLLTCIGYRDHFQNLHHTGTIFRAVKPGTIESSMFKLTPNQSVSVEWREWHSFLD